MGTQRSILLLTLPGSLLCGMAQSGPVHHWPLDEATGTTAYDFAGGSHGSLVDGVQWDTDGGQHNGAARFDGVDDRILLGPCDLTNGGNGITLAMWVKPDFVTAMDRTIIAKASGTQHSDAIWSVTFVNATALRFRLRTGGTVAELLTSPSSIFSGVWYHVVATYDGMEMRIHINGALMGTMARSGSIGSHTGVTTSLGAIHNGAQSFSGWLDDVRIYDHGLNDAEIIQLLFADVTTGSHGHDLRIMPDGRFILPEGTWERLTVSDTAGRVVREWGLGYGSDEMIVGPITPGVYVVLMVGQGTRLAQAIYIQ